MTLANTSHHPAVPELNFRKELDAAMRLARDAGAIIRAFYEVPPTVRWKDPTEPVTEADRAANVFLVKQLAQLFPEDGILAEESKDDLSRLRRRHVWIVDPLDGTAEFIAHNGEFVVMIGLVVDGEPVVGVVYQPINDVLYGAARGSGAFVEEFGERTTLQVSMRRATCANSAWSSVVRIAQHCWTRLSPPCDCSASDPWAVLA